MQDQPRCSAARFIRRDQAGQPTAQAGPDFFGHLRIAGGLDGLQHGKGRSLAGQRPDFLRQPSAQISSRREIGGKDDGNAL